MPTSAAPGSDGRKHLVRSRRAIWPDVPAVDGDAHARNPFGGIEGHLHDRVIARIEVAAERGAHDLLAERLLAHDVDDNLAPSLRYLRLRTVAAVRRQGDVVVGANARIR